MKRVFVLVGLCVLSACSSEGAQSVDGEATTSSAKLAGAGPFGLDPTKGPDSLDISRSDSAPDTGLYLLNSVPRPSSEFETYGVVTFRETGICEVRAITRKFSSDSLGASATTLADSLSKTLASKYGDPEKIDFCAGGSAICQQQFWAMAVSQGDRAYGYTWENPNQSIRSIDLYVISDDLSQLSVRLDYGIGDKQRCVDALNKSRGASL